MDPARRQLSSEERAVLNVLEQEGRRPADRTYIGVATALERRPREVAAVLDRLKRYGLIESEVDVALGEEIWIATTDRPTLSKRRTESRHRTGARSPVPPSCPECGRHLDVLDQTLVAAMRIHDGPEFEHGNGTVRLMHSECFESAPSKWRRVGEV